MRNLTAILALLVGAAPIAKEQASHYAFPIPEVKIAEPPPAQPTAAPQKICDENGCRLVPAYQPRLFAPPNVDTLVPDAPTANPYGIELNPGEILLSVDGQPVSSSSASSVTYASAPAAYSAEPIPQAVYSLAPAATATFYGTPLQFQRWQPVRNAGRLVARIGWRLSGGAIRARRCR